MQHTLRTVLSSLVLSTLLTACSAPATPPAPSPTPTPPRTAFATDVVATFDASARELPEGLFVSADSAYVGFAPTGTVARLTLATGRSAAFGSVPAPITGKGFMTGIAQSRTGDLFVGVASFTPERQPGIYRIAPTGGAGERWAHHDAMAFPNGLAFDTAGALFVTDSAAGSITSIDSTGRATTWITDDSLAGKKYNCGAGLGPGFDIGANGIVVEPDAIYTVNTDKATLVRIPRNADGTAGAPTILAGPDCDQLGGADGLARTADGLFLVAINRQDKLARITADGAVTTVQHGAPLDFPASVATHGSDTYVTNFALYTASTGKPSHPALLKVTSR